MKEEILAKIQAIKTEYHGASFSRYVLVPQVMLIFTKYKDYLSFCKVHIIDYDSLGDQVYITTESENRKDILMVEDFVDKYFDQSLIRLYTIKNIIE